jgi:nucleolar GTP-binding protein
MQIEAIVVKTGATFKTMSNFTDEGIAAVKSEGCEVLLSRRVETKLKASKKVAEVLNRLAVVVPKSRDGKDRTITIPPSVLAARESAAAAAAAAAKVTEDDGDGMDAEEGEGVDGTVNAGGHAVVRKWLERDKERVGGGPGVYKPDFTRYYLLRDDEWKTDIVPELMEGKNIADFVDADILERLLQLEAEEEALEAADAAAAEAEGEVSDEDEETAALYAALRSQRHEAIEASKLAKSNGRPGLPRSKLRRTAEMMRAGLEGAGFDADTAEAAVDLARRPTERGRKRTRDSAGEKDEAMEEEEGEEGGVSRGGEKRARSRSSAAAIKRTANVNKYGDADKARSASRARSREPSMPPAQSQGLQNDEVRTKVIKKFNKFRSIKFGGKQGESDHRIPNLKPKWLLSGKRGIGKTDYR